MNVCLLRRGLNIILGDYITVKQDERIVALYILAALRNGSRNVLACLHVADETDQAFFGFSIYAARVRDDLPLHGKSRIFRGQVHIAFGMDVLGVAGLFREEDAAVAARRSRYVLPRVDIAHQIDVAAVAGRCNIAARVQRPFHAQDAGGGNRLDILARLHVGFQGDGARFAFHIYVVTGLQRSVSGADIAALDACQPDVFALEGNVIQRYAFTERPNIQFFAGCHGQFFRFVARAADVDVLSCRDGASVPHFACIGLRREGAAGVDLSVSPDIAVLPKGNVSGLAVFAFLRGNIRSDDQVPVV